MVWLAYCAVQYIDTTGDAAVLDEKIPFLEGRALQPEEHDAFFMPGVSDEIATLFEHCARALDHALQVGEHGLPLFGTGDWNDGMNRVGEKGKGESVWLGWFLQATLVSFAPVAAARGEHVRATRWLAHAAALQNALEQAWDGDWYRRGYFDDGTPLGSASSAECRIDSIAQSWSVISGAADRDRAARAMGNVDSRLVRHDAGLVLLFTPPFDHIAHDPGYIKGYPPGVRENGGQYTHAATWAVLAQAILGNGAQAAKLFSLLNPISHTGTRADVQRYKVEPYVVAADVYSVAPHVGRGGWTWYTGSASWMYRAGLEWILGFRVRAGKRNYFQARVSALRDPSRKPASREPWRCPRRIGWQEAADGRNSYRAGRRRVHARGTSDTGRTLRSFCRLDDREARFYARSSKIFLKSAHSHPIESDAFQGQPARGRGIIGFWCIEGRA